MTKEEKEILEKFTDFWNHDLMVFAEKCIQDDSDVWANYKNAETEVEQDKHANEMFKRKRIDWVALDMIATFIYSMTYFICEEKSPINLLSRFENIFNSENYYQTVFKGNENCRESKMYKEFGKKLKHGIEILTDDRVSER